MKASFNYIKIIHVFSYINLNHVVGLILFRSHCCTCMWPGYSETVIFDIVLNISCCSPQKLDLTAMNETMLIDNLEIFIKNGFEFTINEEGNWEVGRHIQCRYSAILNKLLVSFNKNNHIENGTLVWWMGFMKTHTFTNLFVTSIWGSNHEMLGGN